jgi:hypothetical protein
MRTQDCLKIVSFLLLLASPALADTINYTFTVYESGVIGSHSFTDSLLTIHVVADNSHLIGNGTGIVPTQTATMTVDGITADLSIGKVFSSGQTPCDANTNWLPNNIPCVGVEVVGPAICSTSAPSSFLLPRCTRSAMRLPQSPIRDTPVAEAQVR